MCLHRDIELSDSQVLEDTALEPWGRVLFKATLSGPLDIAERRGGGRGLGEGMVACRSPVKSSDQTWEEEGRKSLSLRAPLERLRHHHGHIQKAGNEDRVRLEATVLKTR